MVFKEINITLRALFLSLFITENCFSLALTVSPKETFGAFFAFCSQGCSAFKGQIANNIHLWSYIYFYMFKNSCTFKLLKHKTVLH